MTTENQVPPITEEDIAEFLIQTPDFFERQAQVLAGVQMISPYGNRTVSLQERQAEMLRDKIKGLEHRIMDMMRNGSQNHHTIDRIHHWTCDVVKTRNPAQLPEAIAEGLARHFDVPQVAIRLWDVAELYVNDPFAQGVSADARSFAGSLSSPTGCPRASRCSPWCCCRCATAPSAAIRRSGASWCWARPTPCALMRR